MATLRPVRMPGASPWLPGPAARLHVAIPARLAGPDAPTVLGRAPGPPGSPRRSRAAAAVLAELARRLDPDRAVLAEPDADGLRLVVGDHDGRGGGLAVQAARDFARLASSRPASGRGAVGQGPAAALPEADPVAPLPEAEVLISAVDGTLADLLATGIPGLRPAVTDPGTLTDTGLPVARADVVAVVGPPAPLRTLVPLAQAARPGGWLVLPAALRELAGYTAAGTIWLAEAGEDVEREVGDAALVVHDGLLRLLDPTGERVDLMALGSLDERQVRLAAAAVAVALALRADPTAIISSLSATTG